MITREEALIRAEQLLDAEVRPWMDDEVVIDTSATLRAGTSWVFFYNSRIFLETRSMSYALVGNGPVIVSGEDGTTKLARSAIPWEDQV
jgi:Immunity protein 35